MPSEHSVCWVSGLALPWLLGCNSEPRSAPPSLYLEPIVADAGVGDVGLADAGSGVLEPSSDLLPDWCSPPTSALPTIGEISDAYFVAQMEACVRLTEGMDAAALAAWQTYLYDYTRVMVGCVNLVVPPPGGIRVFGPANTLAIGVERGALGRSDAALLIDRYLAAFAGSLSLALAEQAVVEAHLWRSAEPEIDPALVGLSLCASGADAGG